MPCRGEVQPGVHQGLLSQDPGVKVHQRTGRGGQEGGAEVGQLVWLQEQLA